MLRVRGGFLRLGIQVVSGEESHILRPYVLRESRLFQLAYIVPITVTAPFRLH